MQTRIVIITLEMIKDDEFYDEYLLTSSMEKLASVIERIYFACGELQKKEPDAKWLIVWPEHGVTNEERRCLNRTEKSAFKQALQQITRLYPQLAVIAGTVPTVREELAVRTRSNERKFDEKIETIAKAYEKNRWIITVEEQEMLEGYFEGHLNLFKQRRNLPSRAIIRNTAYVFTGGACIARHDKIAPYREEDRYPLGYGFFQLAKGRNEHCHMMIQFPDGIRIPVCIEICREHSLGIARREHAKGRHERPVIHFVLSDSVLQFKENIIGDYFIQSDTSFISELMQMADSPYSVTHYSANLMRPVAVLDGPRDMVDSRPQNSMMQKMKL